MADASIHTLRAAPRDALAIAEVRAWAVSCPVPPEAQITLGVGKMVKRDAVVVRVRSAGGLVGWGEAHHGRSHSAIAAMVNDTLSEVLTGQDGCDVVALNQRMARALMLTQGSGAAAALAISGVDMALWDLRGKAVGWPVCRLLGGAPKPVPAYAGGVALGWDDPDALQAEVAQLLGRGYRAVKQRIGDNVVRDVARLRAVREAVGPDVTLLSDANSLYSPWDVRQVMPVLDELGVRWLEEPFLPQEARRYRDAARFATLPLAAGENLFTRQEFQALIAEGAVTEIQPDLSKVGGLTEGLRIAGMALANGLDVHPHASMTALNAAATLHFLCAIEGGGYLEADVSRHNPLRDELVRGAVALRADGTFVPEDKPGFGVEVDEDFLVAHPPIPGSAYKKVQ